MAGEVIVSTGDLTAGSFYKIKGYAKIDRFIGRGVPAAESENRLNQYVQYLTSGSISFKADANVNVLTHTFIEDEPENYIYAKLTSADLNALVAARNTLLNY